MGEGWIYVMLVFISPKALNLSGGGYPQPKSICDVRYTTIC